MSRVHALLAKRHAEDIYVPECNMGSAGSRVLDAWVMLPTWSPFTTIGYEVKVSRSDWTRDQKFMLYRPVCHLLMVAAEPGIVQPGELPAGVGLLEAVGKGEGGRLIMRVKPVRTEPDHAALVKLMGHVLMWRTRVQHRNDRTETRADRAAKWRAFIDDKTTWSSIGYSVAGKMRRIVQDALDAKRTAEQEADRLKWAAEILEQMGVNASSEYGIRRGVEQALSAGGQSVVNDIDKAVLALTSVRDRVQTALNGHVAPKRTA